MQQPFFSYTTTDPYQGGLYSNLISHMVRPISEHTNEDRFQMHWWYSFGNAVRSAPIASGPNRAVMTYYKDRNGKTFYWVLTFRHNPDAGTFTLVDGLCFNNYRDKALAKITEMSNE